MENRKKILNFVRSFKEETVPSFAYNLYPFNNKVYYSGPNVDEQELVAAIESLLFSKWSVNGPKVMEFENKFSDFIKIKHSFACNSGSSANLILLAAAKEHFGWEDGSEIIVSAVSFPTTVSPIIQNNLVPKFVDIEMDTLNFDVEKISPTPKKKAIFVSPVLGNPPDIDKLIHLSEKHNLILLLDGCDSLGSMWDKRSLPSFFYASSCSFYPAHHITTLQGGMVSSNNAPFIEICKSISAWGRSCYCRGMANLLPNGVCGKRFSKWITNLDCVVDHKYVYDRMGYNLQLPDVLAAIGVEQLNKIEDFEKKRKFCFDRISNALSKSLNIKIPKPLAKADPSWFGVPIICHTSQQKNKLVQHFEKNGIQTRNYFAGNILKHAGFSQLCHDEFPKADEVLSKVFFIGCWPGYKEEHLNHIEKTISSYE